jgi:hypothetical protein
MRIATAGSCFAQHIARRLQESGYKYFVTEPGADILPSDVARRFNYGTFTARFGNIYTVRQLRQLLERAYGRFKPMEPFWLKADGRVIDPFRPQIQPQGFASIAEAEADRITHLAAVRRMVEQSDVFVFTLGLTEAWECTSDGAILPICPGCGAGIFDPARYRFRNLGVRETIADLESAVELLREHNPALRILLTVSPVPLIATASGDHVLPATIYSKSVLRAAAAEVAAGATNIDYFPSYEIITSSASAGRYFAADLREVRPEGVAHVMRVFFRHYTDGSVVPEPKAPLQREVSVAAPRSLDNISQEMAIICDEEILDQVSST